MGTGALDEDVAGATFDLEMTGLGGVKLLSCQGDASTSKTCNFPLKKGQSQVKVDIQLSGSLPPMLATTKTITKATSKSGDKLFCMEIDSSKADANVHPERAAQIEKINNAEGVLWKAAAHPRFASQAPGASKDLCGVKNITQQGDIIKKLVKLGEMEVFESEANAAVPDNFDSE